MLVQQSLSIDKASRKMVEHSIEYIEKVKQIQRPLEMYAFLGIINIFQTHFLLVATEVEEICRVEANLSKKVTSMPPVIFCLTKVDLIPFDRLNNNMPAKTKE